MAENRYHIHVDAEKQSLALNFREIWAYRDLIWLFTKRTFKLIYKQTVLGPLWIVMSPLFTSIVYTIIFGRIAGLSTGGTPKLLFYLCSHALWSFFSASLSQNASAFIANAHVYRKVYFPRLTIPISNTISCAFQMLIQMSMVIVLVIWYGLKGVLVPHLQYLPVLVPTILCIVALSFGLGTLVSSLTTKYRDLGFLVGFGLQLWMYLSPVIYPVAQVSQPVLRRFLLINPMTAPMEIFRFVLLGSGTVEPLSVISTVFFSIAALLTGVAVFRKAERTFVDTI